MPTQENASAMTAIVLALVMVVTGSVNTLAAKWADSLKVDGKRFNHPFVQSLCMFVGEVLCLLVYLVCKLIQRRRTAVVSGAGGRIIELDYDPADSRIMPNFNPLIFFAPAVCDVLATSIMYIGLNLTQASSFQMLRGAVIIFTGLFSVAFLNTRLQPFRWLGMIFVTIGLVIVGVSDIIFDENPNDDINGIITGDLLIIIAQIIVAIQMVLEQRFISKYDVPPLLVVGLEGMFGMMIVSFLLIPMYFIHVPHTFSTNPHNRLEDVFDAIREVGENPLIAIALSLTIFSIAFFNFAGVSVTKHLSATTRMVLDSIRTLVIWIVSFTLLGEHFIAMQILGFALLILGMFVYNDIFIGPYFRLNILARMGSNGFTRCCIGFWGIDFPEMDRRILVDEDDNS